MQIVVQRAAVDHHQPPIGRPRQRERLADGAPEVLAGQREQPIVVDLAARADQRAVLGAPDVEDMWRDPQLLG
ncbi:MAG TPA: hypothetical protein VFG23_26925, partial [Polyangia bacterium]|nr:hypothetical protein [Polyangia bacterium]